MVGFSVQDVAFGGFADVRRHPRALWVWAPLAFVTSLTLQVVSLPMAGLGLAQLSMSQDPTVAMAVLRKVLPVEAATLVVGLLVTAVVQAAMIRMVLRPGDSRFGYVRLGADELRQLAVAVMGLAVGLLVTFVVSCVAAIGLGVVGSLSGAPTGLVIYADMAGTICVVLGVSVRLSLAPALTFERRRVDLFGSWRLTRGRFWPLFGAYAMVLGLCAGVYVVAAGLIFGLGGLVLGPDIVPLSREPSNLTDLFNPMRLILAAFGGFLVALVWPVVFTPSARLYVALAPVPEVDVGARGAWG